MRIGFNMLLWTGKVGPEHYAILEDLKKTGYDGVEIPVFEGKVADYTKLGKHLKSLGLVPGGLGLFGSLDANPIGAEPASRKAALAHMAYMLECCEAMGATQIGGPIHSVLGHFSGAGPTADELKRGAEFHRKAGDIAKKHKVLLTVEALNRFENYFLTTMEGLASYIKDVNHPNVMGMYDTFHANIEEQDPIAAIEAIRPFMAHVHISENDRGTPGRGHIKLKRTIKALKKGGYDNWLTIEAFGRALPQLAAATRVWRDLFPNPEQVYREGYSLIRKAWDKA